jgi:ABC-2 type transport system ATP-binding protein
VQETLLEAESLTKIFKRRLGHGFKRLLRGGIGENTEFAAVDGVNFSVKRGDIFGFLGPNGAGKSTTIRMLLGLIHPSAGRVAIGGHDLSTQRILALRKVGAFVEHPSFYQFLSGRENLEIFAGLSGGVSADEFERIITLVGLKGRENEQVQVYSHGMRQRLGIAACLLPMPEVLVLDEPTDGLDPHGIHETRELIKKLSREEGLTIFLSSHLLGEVENLCNRIAILEKGKIILQGDLTQLEAQYRHGVMVTDHPEKAATLLRTLGITAELDSRDKRLRVPPGTDLAAVNSTLMQAGFLVRSLAPEPNWLDRLFLQLTTSKEALLKNQVAGGRS